MAISHLDIVRDFLPVTNANRPRTRLKPVHIAIHNTGNPNPGADAKAHAQYMKGAEAQARQVSWHFTVDDRVIIQSLPRHEIGWHCGPGNASSLGIEICMNEGMDEAKAYESAAQLVAFLSWRHRIAVPEGIRQHHDWTGKDCPAVLRARPDGWSRFLDRVRVLHRELRATKREKQRPAAKKPQPRAQPGGRKAKRGP